MWILAAGAIATAAGVGVGAWRYEHLERRDRAARDAAAESRSVVFDSARLLVDQQIASSQVIEAKLAGNPNMPPLLIQSVAAVRDELTGISRDLAR